MCTAYQVGGSSIRQEANRPSVLQLFLDAMAEESASGRSRKQLIRPTNVAPVIMPDGAIAAMHWGFRVKVPGASGKLLVKTVVNAREDKLETRTWKKAFQERRCIIPASAYYEWTGAPGSKQAHLFTRPDLDWMWLAGIWEEHPEHGRCYSMLTTEPNRVAAFVHDRMPAILRPEEIGPYLAGEMRNFHPAEDVLQAVQVPSPLSKAAEESAETMEKAPPPEPTPPAQGELF